MIIIDKTDNASLYNEITRTMLKKDPNKTKIILEGIREKDRKDDVITTRLDEIMNEI